ERAFALRMAATTAAYVAAVTPPPPPPPSPRRVPRGRRRAAVPAPAPPPAPAPQSPAARRYDLPSLLTQSHALSTLPGWSSDVEVYFGTAPLVDATAPPLSPDDLQLLAAGGRWRDGAALVPLKDREGQEVVGAVAVRPRSVPHGPLPGGLGFAFPAAMIAVGAVATIAFRQHSLRRGGYMGVAMLIGSGRWIELRSVPAEAEAPKWLILLLPGALLGPLAIMALRWAERTAVRSRRETAMAWGFLAPAALHLLMFTIGPAIYALYLASLANFRALVRDPLTWNSFVTSAAYALYVPISIALALAVALAVHRYRERGGWGRRLVSVAFLLPYVSSVVAIALLWQATYHAGSLGLGRPDWLSNSHTALLALMLVSIWAHVGGQMLVFLGGLDAI